MLIALGFAITDFKSQGKSVDSACIDIKLGHKNGHPCQPGVNHKHYTSLNVQLGRVRSLAGLWLQELIKLADVQCRPEPAFYAKMERLCLLEEQTIRIWNS